MYFLANQMACFNQNEIIVKCIKFLFFTFTVVGYELNTCNDFHEALYLKCGIDRSLGHGLVWGQYGYIMNIYLILEIVFTLI